MEKEKWRGKGEKGAAHQTHKRNTTHSGKKKKSALLVSGPACIELGSDHSTITINKKLNKLKINNSS